MVNPTWLQGLIAVLLLFLIFRTFGTTATEQPSKVVLPLKDFPSCAPCPTCAAQPSTAVPPQDPQPPQPPQQATVAPTANYSIANQYCGNVLIERQPWNSHKRILSYSLFANNSGAVPEFLVYGLRQNIKAAKLVYPDWILRLYVINVSSAFIDDMAKEETVEIVECVPAGTKAKQMLWRFFAYDDPKVARFLSRDLDSRLTFREMFAVHEWMGSGLGFHAIRDHQYHVIPIMGGMFGMRRGVLGTETMESIVTTALQQHPGSQGIPGCCADDQNFLATYIWPKVSGKALSTDSSSGRCFGAAVCHDFPVGPRFEEGFVGFPVKNSTVEGEVCEMNCRWV